MTNEQRMTADKALTTDINRATSFEDMRSLLHNAAERSGIVARDPETGQFARRDPLTPAKQDAAAEDAQVTKTETIGGKEFVFTGTALEVEQKIGDAYKVAEALKPAEIVVTRAQTQAEKEREIVDRVELDMQFRRGELTSAEYLERTNAVGEYLAAKGFDVVAAGAAQMAQSWGDATTEFLNNTPEGSIWRGGQKNLEIAGNLLLAHGWDNAASTADKVAALRTVAKEMAEKGLMFDGDLSVEQLNKLTDSATPSEILEAWKQSHGGDADAANVDFIRLGGGSGGLFNH